MMWWMKAAETFRQHARTEEVNIYRTINQHNFCDMCSLQGGPKMAQFLYALTLSNINRFSKLFHFQNQEKMCNNTVTNDPTTPQVCRYTTL